MPEESTEIAEAQSIAVTTHGRYFVEPPATGRSRGSLVGFHGYAESAEIALERLRAIPGAEQWTLVAVQGLHRFYRGRSTAVVASWMTRQDRDSAIDDNNRYVSAVLAATAERVDSGPSVVFAGFSQGVAMAFRAACSSTRVVRGVVAVGGDVPPELSREQLARLPVVLLVRGRADEWYSAAQWDADQARLRAAGVDLTSLEFEGGHEWHTDVSRAAAAWLHRMGRAPED